MAITIIERFIYYPDKSGQYITRIYPDVRAHH